MNPYQGINAPEVRFDGRVLSHIKTQDKQGSKQIQYTFIKKIAEGSQGQVWLAQSLTKKPLNISGQIANTTFTKECAIKVFDMKMYDVQMVEHESKLLAQFKHRNIVRRYDSFVVEIDHRQYYLLVLEYCEEGTLESYLLYFQYRLTREQGYQIFAQILDGVQVLHNKDIIHRDIKPANILVKKEGDQLVFKLSDFGMARKLEAEGQLMATYVGTKNYMAIEVIKNERYSVKADLWSLAVILYEILYGTHPFSVNYDNLDDINRKIFVKGGFKVPAQLKPTAEESLLFNRIFRLEKSPDNDPKNDRMNFNELLQSEIVSKYVHKPKLQEMKKFYLDKFGEKLTRGLVNNNVVEWYENALDYELARLEFLWKLSLFVQSIIGSEDFEEPLFLLGKVLSIYIKYYLQLLYEQQTKVFELSRGEKVKEEEIIGYQYIKCFVQAITNETNMDLPSIISCIGGLVKGGRISKLDQIRSRTMEMKPNQPKLGQSLLLKERLAAQIKEIEVDPIGYLEIWLIPRLTRVCREHPKEKFNTALLVNLQVLRLLDSTVLIDLSKKLKIFLEWLDDNNYPHDLARFVEWSQLNTDFGASLIIKLSNIKRDNTTAPKGVVSQQPLRIIIKRPG